jgi:hypothetical protein
MFAIAAATQMSNTSCFFALAWMLACWLRARRPDAGDRWWIGAAAAFGLAVLIRPTSAVGTGGPVLIAMAIDVLRGERGQRLRRVLAIAVPGAIALTIFLGINKVQNGAFLKTSYAREFEYAKENGLRFSNWGVRMYRLQLAAGTLKPHFSLRPFADNIGNAAAAFLRLNAATFGWVPSLIFLPFASGEKGTRVLVAMVLGHFAIHFNVLDLGIDTFGAHHYFEVGLPILMLTVIAARRVARWLAERDAEGTTYVLPGALLVGFTLFAILCTHPPRLRAISRMSEDANLARDYVQQAGLHRAVVFAPAPFTTRYAKCTEGPKHYVYWRPNNDPDLKNDILWVNHITPADNRQLMQHFPDRKAFIYYFDDHCAPTLVPLESPEADKAPPGNVDGLHPNYPRPR